MHACAAQPLKASTGFSLICVTNLYSETRCLTVVSEATERHDMSDKTIHVVLTGPARTKFAKTC